MTLVLATAASAPHPIGIVINGDALSLDPPAHFEARRALRARTPHDRSPRPPFTRAGNRISTQIGSKSVVLTIGSRIARVRRRPNSR